MLYQQQHLTDSVIMVPPYDFCYNQQTAEDNEYQHRPAANQNQELIKRQVMDEFTSMVEQIRASGVEVLLLDKPQSAPVLPDALFPNNWFSTRSDGQLVIYPMKTENRRAEVQVEELQRLLHQSNYPNLSVSDVRQFHNLNGTALEGTGSIVFHHPSGSIFAAYSERCDVSLLQKYTEEYQYQCYPFTTKSADGRPIYHTNVMMSCGEHFALITTDVLEDTRSNQKSIEHLRKVVDEVIVISEQQMKNSFCGNILQLKNSKQESLLLMSESAYSGYTKQQISQLSGHGEFIICSIPTIEYIGGGSCRCMVAENFISRG